MSEATDVVDRQIAAFRDRDLERYLGFYAADVKIRDFDGNVLMEGMRGMYGPLFRDSPELRVEIPRRMVAGDYGGHRQPGIVGCGASRLPARLRERSTLRSVRTCRLG
jgi:hypothetical protein